METTAHKADWREQLDLSTPHALRKENEPLYYSMFGPNQWPNEKAVPDFRPLFEDYMRRMSEISMFFTSLIAESLDMPSDAFDRFFDKDQYESTRLVCPIAADPFQPTDSIS